MAKRRANGEGNLRKRKDGRWEGRYTAGRDPETGRAIYKNVLGKTQAEAKAKLKQAISYPTYIYIFFANIANYLRKQTKIFKIPPSFLLSVNGSGRKFQRSPFNHSVK